MNYENRFSKLNKSQQEAVSAIDGPVMVIAGPGTGKTELLSMRVANILKKTDTLPENILCLTFTDSGADAMSERLAQIIGKDAYRVAVHTFHSFCEEVINQNRQFFYNGADYKVADELSKYEIMGSIFDELDHKNLLASRQNGEYTYLKDSATIISELKSSGLVGEELNQILDDNEAVIEKIEQLVVPILESVSRINKSILPKLAETIDQIQSSGHSSNPKIKSLSEIASESLARALDDCRESNKTSPLTIWKDSWFRKDDNKKYILKSRINQQKLRSLIFIYDKYVNKMNELSLYDFDDMILNVAHTIETQADLRFNLQEKYQYILVDEFQDTNMAQMRILNNLTDSFINEGLPNIFVVGDDDQAIYSFQGAEISNILDFTKSYPKTKQITLTDNYRSSQVILDGSRKVIVQAKNRLENYNANLNKQLKASASEPGHVKLYEAESIADERLWLMNSIQKLIKSGVKPNEITVIARKHHELNELLPYFYRSNLLVNYERKDNALEIPIIILIEKLARLIVCIADGKHDEANALLPEIMSHKMWGIEPRELWRISLKAYDDKKHWLELMQDNENKKISAIYDWLIDNSVKAAETPLELMIDIITGKPSDENENSSPKSPVYDFYFSEAKLKENPDEYLTCLEALRTIRSQMRNYRPDLASTIKTFINFIDLNRKAKSPINITRKTPSFKNAINIMTAHKAKGLEFEHVFIINAVDNLWGEKAHDKARLINYPENLPIARAGENYDERLRLFYVAMTRAKINLNISFSQTDSNSKPTMLASFLCDESWIADKIEPPSSIKQLIEAAEINWYQQTGQRDSDDIKELLLPRMSDYKMSVTHLNSFLNLKRGGPSSFFVQNILMFPQAKGPSAVYGTAMHQTIQQAHDFIVVNKQKQAIEDIIANFEKNLSNQRMTKLDYEKYLNRGRDNLMIYLEKYYDSFTNDQQTEISFNRQNSLVGPAKINGKLDLVDINKTKNTMVITDYKTGSPSSSWKGKDDDEKIKLSNYKRQLMFYQLLVEGSRDYRKYAIEKSVLQFIEPSRSNNIYKLESNFSKQELDEFKLLVVAVWKHIISLDMPDTSGYQLSASGIQKFENDLIQNII